MLSNKDVTKMSARGEYVIINVGQPAKAGEEIKTAGGLVIGRREQGEIPRWGRVVSTGSDVPSDQIDVDDIVLVPEGNCREAVNTEIISEQAPDKKGLDSFVFTHYKNVAVVYS